jgi:hypothetical protein
MICKTTNKCTKQPNWRRRRRSSSSKFGCLFVYIYTKIIYTQEEFGAWLKLCVNCVLKMMMMMICEGS